MFNKKRGKAFLTMLLLMASLGLAACSQNREAEADKGDVDNRQQKMNHGEVSFPVFRYFAAVFAAESL